MPVLSNAKVIFCNVSSPDDYSQKYQLVVGITEEQAADAEEAGINVKTKEFDGKTQFQVAFKTKFKILHNIRGIDGVTVLDLEGGELARGSLINVQFEFKPWEMQGKTGISQHLTGIQVLVAETGGKNEFGDATQAAGGDTQGDM